jgi:hypothetical protein
MATIFETISVKMGNGISLVDDDGKRSQDANEISLAFGDEIEQNAQFKAIMENEEILSSKQIQEYIVPIILKANAAKLTNLRNTITTNTQMRDLINEFGFQPIDKTLSPIESKKSLGGIVRSGTKSTVDFIAENGKDILGLWTEKEKIEETHRKIGETANRIAQKFNSYVIAGDGKEYGNDLDPFITEDETDVFSGVSDKVDAAADDISRSSLIDWLNAVVTSARSGEVVWEHHILRLINGEELTYPTELDKVQAALSRLEKVEAGVDEAMGGGMVQDMMGYLSDKSIDVSSIAFWTACASIGLVVTGTGFFYTYKFFKAPIVNSGKIVKVIANTGTYVYNYWKSDTPSYTHEEWEKEKIKAGEAIRKSVYTDPRYNTGVIIPNSTGAEITFEISTNPVLQREVARRMAELEKINAHAPVTPAGAKHEKYADKRSVDKAVKKSVAPAPIDGKKKYIPFTPENRDHLENKKRIQEAQTQLKKIGAELKAVALMDGVQVPAVLTNQLNSLNRAYTAAYEADRKLDTLRIQVNKTGELERVVQWVITKYREIDAHKTKLNWVEADITLLQTELNNNKSAVSMESPEMKRNREVEWLKDEVSSLNDTITGLRSEIANIEAKEIQVNQRIREYERQIRERKQLLNQWISDSTGKSPIRKSNPDWQMELNNPNTMGELWTLNSEIDTLKKIDLINLASQQTAKKLELTTNIDERDNLNKDKRAILSQPAAVNAKDVQSDIKEELEKKKWEKEKIEEKIKALNAEIDTIASQPGNKKIPSPWRGGNLTQAQTYHGEIEAQLNSTNAGSYMAQKNEAKAVRDDAFADLNIEIRTVNIETARIWKALPLNISHISEFNKWQGYDNDASFRENGLSGDKPQDHKLKAKKPDLIRQIIKPR